VGLDVYVGTLTRYVVGDWELTVEAAGRELGIPVRVERAEPEPEDAIRDPDLVREAVLDWRADLEEALGTDLSWSEADEMPYFTDKPDWHGYFGLLSLAAHDEHPDEPMPAEFPDGEQLRHPLLRRVTGSRKRASSERLFGRKPTELPRCFALYAPELWLPTELEAAWSGPLLSVPEIAMSSTVVLRAQLRELANRIGASEQQLVQWREKGSGGEVIGTREMEGGQVVEEIARGSPQDEGHFGLAVFLDLVERAVEHRLPMKLDY